MCDFSSRRLLFDTNVLLDAVCRERPQSAEACEVLRRCNGGGDLGLATCGSLKDVYYILSRGGKEAEARASSVRSTRESSGSTSPPLTTCSATSTTVPPSASCSARRRTTPSLSTRCAARRPPSGCASTEVRTSSPRRCAESFRRRRTSRVASDRAASRAILASQRMACR